LSCDALSLCFVIGDELVKDKVYEGLAPIIFFFLTSARHGEVLSFDHVEVALGYLGPEP
jgi:hypothetical protein